MVSLNLLNAFDNPVSLACTVKPAQAGSPTCSLSSNSVTFDSGGKANATLTITAGSAAASLMVPHFNHPDSYPLRFIWVPAAGFAFIGVGLSRNPWRRRKPQIFLAGSVVFAGLISQLACGGSSSPPPVNYAITITGMSGSTLQSTTLTVTVH